MRVRLQAQKLFRRLQPASQSILRHRPVAAVNVFDQSDAFPSRCQRGLRCRLFCDKEVRIQKVGQSVHGRVAEPVYAFDKLVVPVGTRGYGPDHSPRKLFLAGKRTLDALNADFSPPRKVQIEFDDLKLIDGRHIPIHTTVTPGSGQVIQFVTAADDEKKKGVKSAASAEERTRQRKKPSGSGTMR